MSSLREAIKAITRRYIGSPGESDELPYEYAVMVKLQEIEDEKLAIDAILSLIRAEVEKVENPWVVNGVPLAGDFEEARKRIMEALK